MIHVDSPPPFASFISQAEGDIFLGTSEMEQSMAWNEM